MWQPDKHNADQQKCPGLTWNGYPVTAVCAFAATFEGPAVELMVDDMLKAPQQHAEKKGGDDQTSICAKSSSLRTAQAC